LVKSLWRHIYTKYEPGQRIALVAPYIFDASVQQIFASLLLGHSLYIVPSDIRTDGEKLTEYYVENLIDISDGTPTHISIIVGQDSPMLKDMRVKHFIIGGEALGVSLVEKFLDKCIWSYRMLCRFNCLFS
jgi:non-ribosomal peptide synthetase component F